MDVILRRALRLSTPGGAGSASKLSTFLFPVLHQYCSFAKYIMKSLQSELTEERPFLLKGPTSPAVDDDSELGDTYLQAAKRSPCEQCIPWLIHLLVFTTYTTIFILLWDYSHYASCPGVDNREFSHAYSESGIDHSSVHCLQGTLGPASEALRWEVRTFQNQLEASNPYKGPPRPELEEAWHNLLHPSAAIRVSKEALDRINRTSVELLDGSGYMVALDVYHQLHCLVCIQYSTHEVCLLLDLLLIDLSHRDGCAGTFTGTTTI